MQNMSKTKHKEILGFFRVLRFPVILFENDFVDLFEITNRHDLLSFIFLQRINDNLDKHYTIHTK